MPGPFERPPAPDADDLSDALERGSRAQQVLALGVGVDLDRRRLAILEGAERELRGGTLTPDRAFMHIACCNALRRYKEELTTDIDDAQRAADKLHAESNEAPTDGDV